MVNGSQITGVCHVEDLKVSHVSNFEITKFACYLDKIYGGLAVKVVKVHNYLGVHLDLLVYKKVQLSMIPYLNNILHDFPEHLGTMSVSPDVYHMLKVRPKEEAQTLPEEHAVAFHHVVAQLIFLISISRRDIQTAVAVLTTRVKQLDEGSWSKLKCVLRYLKGTHGLKINLSVDYFSTVKW